MLKKILALTLALICCVTLFVGCGNRNKVNFDKDSYKGSTDLDNYVRPDLSGVTITQYMTANSDYDPDGCWLDGQIEELLGCTHKVEELDSWGSQYIPMIAEGKVPDISWLNSYTAQYIRFGREGVYVNFYDYLDILPNINYFLNDAQNAADVARYTLEDGVMYALPIHHEGSTAPNAFLYRKDVFDKYGLTFPTNQEEFVDTLRKLKELEPDSKPFIMRSMEGNIQGAQSFGHLWGASHVLQGNYGTIFTLDENGNYFMAQQSLAYKEMAQFFYDMIQEGLMHKSSMTVDTAGWMEAFASDTSFITFDKVDRLPLLNRTGTSLGKAGFEIVAAAPFNFGTYATTTDVVSTSWGEGIGSGTGYVYCIGANENMGNTLAYMDWLYSREGQILTNWGVEGVSWEWEDQEAGVRKYVDGFLDAQGGRTKSGLGTPALTSVIKFDAYTLSLTESEKESLELAQQFLGKNPAQHKILFTDEEQFDYDSYGTACYNYAQSQWSKFVLGERPFSEWDQVVKELKANYQYDRMMEIHKAALERLLAEHPEIQY